MIQEHDVVKLKRNIKTIDWEGEQVSLTAGDRGTVMLIRAGVPECLVEFGRKATEAFMIMVNKKDLQLFWTPRNRQRRAKRAKV